MKILVIGGGGREHALAWKFAQSSLVSEVLVAPGNAGTIKEEKVRNVSVKADDLDGLLNLAQTENIGLTIVGPEQPLVEGVVDLFEAAGLKCFGPRAAAAKLEGSKAFSKEFLERHNIPTATYKDFEDLDKAIEYVRSSTFPIVIKADGLAAGKGVIITETLAEAEDTLRRMLEGKIFGQAGSKVVIEEFLYGEEASFIAIVDDTRIVPLASSQDHKTRDEGDQGPNTGGMGAYSPAPVMTKKLSDQVMQDIILPTVEGMHADGMNYRGFLYAGLMIDPNGNTKVLEFNCRFGDPETQPILIRLRSDLAALCLSAFDGSLESIEIEWDPRASLGVVMASDGYPENYRKGDPITGLDNILGENSKVFHAGTTLDEKNIVTNGGRVLCAVALGKNVTEAAANAYDITEKIDWEGAFYRHDIGYRAIKREQDQKDN
jgi:phosphoribosylamine--glycine ligase|tara:strand:- start:1030 stop:2328 length:1299 start_codon:yes stop_codon:yes gene_type:complete